MTTRTINDFSDCPDRAAPRAGAWKSVEAVLIRLSDALLTWQERASQRHHLYGMSDRMLHDVGLSRADLEREAAKPFWQK